MRIEESITIDAPREEVWALIRDPATYALIAAGIVSFLFYASALEAGSVTVATAAVVLAETLPPAAGRCAGPGRRGSPGSAPAGVPRRPPGCWAAPCATRSGR